MYNCALTFLVILYLFDCGMSEISNGGKIMNKIKTVARKSAHTKKTDSEKPLLQVKIVKKSREGKTRRHLETNDSSELEYPGHLDDLLYYVSTTRPYYTVGPVRAEQFQHEVKPSDPCDDIYRDMVLRDLSAVDNSESEMSKESVETNAIPKKREQNARTNDDEMFLYVNN